MKQELAAVFALMKLLVTKLHVQKTELFIEKLLVALKEKFQDHWYPDNPSKGQAYRCIRVNLSNSQDPELMRACKESGVQFCELGLPPVLTLWVDPGEVACRIGEDNPCFSVARFPNNSKSGVEDSSSSGSDSDSSSGYDSTDASLLPISSRRCSDTNASAFRLPAWYAKALLPGKSHILPRAH
ncbi:protein BTG3 isoform X2 [Hippocampus zosterae]|uniref:protein BTG3 isoform X2 n=1 Tax=Hippocampus zosterae TaxID=109293 RepID=UPI00223CA4E6|nr:protein BTG3 isoform X2 [Hippocampus zosterae]